MRCENIKQPTKAEESASLSKDVKIFLAKPGNKIDYVKADFEKGESEARVPYDQHTGATPRAI